MSADPAEREIRARLLGLARESSLAAARERLADLPPAPTFGPDSGAELTAVFLNRLERNGASSCVVRDRQGVVAAVADFVAACQSQRRFVAGHDARLAALPWRDRGLLPRFGAAEPSDRIAVSYAQAGVAESGSLVLWANRDNPAVNNLLCEAQLVIVERADICSTLDAVWAAQRLQDPQRRPRGIMLVSGPSSTADIAMQLVLGAHGPAALHVVLVDPDAVEAAGDRGGP